MPDFGCGAGRDLKYFVEAGLDVTAIDGEQNCVKLLKDTQEFRYSRCCFKN